MKDPLKVWAFRLEHDILQRVNGCQNWTLRITKEELIFRLREIIKFHLDHRYLEESHQSDLDEIIRIVDDLDFSEDL